MVSGALPFGIFRKGPMQPARSSADDVYVGHVPNFHTAGRQGHQVNDPYQTFACGNQLPPTTLSALRHANYIIVTSQDNRQPLFGVQSSFGVNMSQRTTAVLLSRMRALWQTASQTS